MKEIKKAYETIFNAKKAIENAKKFLEENTLYFNEKIHLHKKIDNTNVFNFLDALKNEDILDYCEVENDMFFGVEYQTVMLFCNNKQKLFDIYIKANRIKLGM